MQSIGPIGLIASARADELVAGSLNTPVPSAPSDEEVAAIGRAEQRRVAEGRDLLAVTVGLEVGGRRYSYSDALSPNTPAYSVLGVPLLSFGIAAHPAAATGLPFLRDLGLRGWVARAVGLDSATLAGTHFGTEWTRFGGDLHERILLPAARRLQLGVGVGLEANFFDMGAAGALAASLPGARTTSLRAGLDARLPLGDRLALYADGAYLLALDASGVYSRFRAPTVAGIDVGGGLSVRLGGGLEARLCARYTRYFSAFAPIPGDAYVAGGALDETVQFGAGLTYAR